VSQVSEIVLNESVEVYCELICRCFSGGTEKKMTNRSKHSRCRGVPSVTRSIRPWHPFVNILLRNNMAVLDVQASLWHSVSTRGHFAQDPTSWHCS
jgi:hypothetical protein